MAKQKILMATTCHGHSVANILKLSNFFNENFEIEEILFNANTPVESVYKKLKNINIFLYQNYHTTSKDQFLSHMLPGGTVIKIPYFTTKIYWPSHNLVACRYHPQTHPEHFTLYCCDILDKLIRKYRSVDKVIKLYSEMDLSQHINLEKNFQEQLLYLKRVGQDTGFKIDDFVVNNFKRQQLFHSINYPTTLIFANIANRILNLLGANETVTYNDNTPCRSQTAIHPSIIEHYKLDWCNNDTVWNILLNYNVTNYNVQGTFKDYLKIYVESKLNYKP